MTSPPVLGPSPLPLDLPLDPARTVLPGLPPAASTRRRALGLGFDVPKEKTTAELRLRWRDASVATPAALRHATANNHKDNLTYRHWLIVLGRGRRATRGWPTDVCVLSGGHL